MFIIPRDDFLRDEYINTIRKGVGFFPPHVSLSFFPRINSSWEIKSMIPWVFITCSMGEVGNGIGFVMDDDQRVCDALYFCWFFFFLPCFELWKLLWRDGFNYFFFFCLFNFSSKNNGLFVLLGTRRKCSIHSDRRNDITIVVIIFIGSLVMIINVLLFL